VDPAATDAGCAMWGTVAEAAEALEASKITLLEVVVDEADERAPALEEGDETEAGADKLGIISGGVTIYTDVKCDVFFEVAWFSDTSWFALVDKLFESIVFEGLLCLVNFMLAWILFSDVVGFGFNAKYSVSEMHLYPFMPPIATKTPSHSVSVWWLRLQ
jgi:hypothetical protein